MDNRNFKARQHPESVRRKPQNGAPQPVRKIQNLPENGSQYHAGRGNVQTRQNSGNSGSRSSRAVRNPETVMQKKQMPVRSNVSSVSQRNTVRYEDASVRDLNQRAQDAKKKAKQAKKEADLKKETIKWLAQYKEDVKVQEADEAVEKEWQEEVVRCKGTLDFPLLFFAILLLLAGTITVFSASYPLAVYENNDPTKYISRQIIYTAAGLVAAFFAAVIPPSFYKKWLPFIIYAAGIGLLVAALFIGTVEGETMRWIDFGPFNVQPSEIMKVGVIFVLAWYFDRFEKKVNDITLNLRPQFRYNILIPGCILGVACVLIMAGKHLSGFAITAAIGGLMMLVATRRPKWLVATVTPMAVVGGVAYLIANPYALLRITAALDKNPDKQGAMYQTLQSINAIGSGGLMGVGFGESRQKHHFLTQSHTDFIFSIWCEETGFVGAVALIILFLAVIWRGYTVARRAPDKFTMLLAFGITTHIGIQAFLHMMVTTKLFVNTGVTLPFFSYGGSSLLVFMAEMGVLLCISRSYCRSKADLEREQLMQQMGMD